MKELFFSEKGLYYRVNEFQPARPTLVFVHGLSGSSSAWVPYEQKFEKDYNILTFDLRGHGQSVKPRNYQDYEIRNFVEDIHALVTHLGLEKFILVSHSFGALVALDFLLQYPARLNAAVLVSPSFSVKKRRLARALKPIFSFTRILCLFPHVPSVGRHINYSRYKNTGDWNIRRMFADIRNTGLRVYLYATRQAYSFDRERFLDGIELPVLIVHGKNDTIFPAAGAIVMAEKIKNSKLILLAKADHILVLNNFHAVSEAIENFIRDTCLSNSTRDI